MHFAHQLWSNTFLSVGFNPPEKYSSNPEVGVSLTNIWNHHLGLLSISTPKKRHHQLTVVEHPACNFSLTPSSAWSEVRPFVFGWWKHLGEHHWRYKFHNPSNSLDKLNRQFKGNNRAQWFLTLNTWVILSSNLLGHTLFAPEISYATCLSHFSPAFHTSTPKLVAEKPVTHNAGYLRYQELVHSNNLLHPKTADTKALLCHKPFHNRSTLH